MLRIQSIIGFSFVLGPFWIPSQAQTIADQHFQSRCTAPGVVKCISFDSRSGLGLTGAAVIDTDVKVSGAGSMRVDIAPTAGDAPGNVTTSMGGTWGENSSLYMQWRQRFSPEMIDVNLGGEGFKQFVIYDGQPCGPNMEVAMLNQNFRGFPVFYAACGGSYFRKTLTGGGYAHMWSGDTTICTNSNTAACLRYLPDQWMTFYYEQKIGNWGQANSSVTVWMAGENQPLRKFIDLQNYTFRSDAANSAYRTIWIGPYSMGRTANASYPTARTWFDEFIISNQPIAAPPISSSPIRKPESISAAQKVDITLHDMQGRVVKRFRGVEEHQIPWNALALRAGLYVVKVHAGNQEWSRKVSILK